MIGERVVRSVQTAGWPLLAGLLVGAGVAVNPVLPLAALVGLGVLAAGIRWPAFGAGLIFLAMFFDQAGVTGVKVAAFPVTAAKLSVLVGLGMWAANSLLTRAPIVRYHPVQLGLAAFITTTLLSVVHANDLAEGKFPLFGLVMMLVLISLLHASLAEVELSRLYRFFAVVLVVGVLASLRGAGVVSEAGRASGTLGDANEWATILLLVGFFVLGHLTNDETRLGVVLRWAVLVLVPLGLLRSESRASLLVLTLCSPGLWLLLRRHRGQLLTMAGMGAAIAPFVLDVNRAWSRLQNLIERLQGKSGGASDSSLDERTELLHQGIQLFKDHWFLGAGAGRFEEATGFISPTGELRPAHNTYLEVASEQGIVGLFGAACFIGTVGVSLYRAWRGAEDPARADRVLGAAMAMAAVGLMAFTLGLLTFSIAWLLLGVSMAVMVQASAPRPSNG